MSSPSRTRLALATLAVAGAFVSVELHAADVIQIGLVRPTTGAVKQYGDMVQEGVDTAVEVANAAGGIQGKKIQLMVVDDACEPKQGPVAANRIVNAGVKYVIGPVCSGATIAAAGIYEGEGVVMVTPSATAPALTAGKSFKFIFRATGRDDQQGPAAARFIAQTVKPKKIAVLHDKQSYGQGVAASVRDELKRLGTPAAMFEGINAGDTDYSAVITKLKSNRVDFVYYGGYHPELGLLLRQGAEQGLKARMMGPEGAGNPEINAIAGPAVEGMLVTLPADFSTNPKNAAIVKVFKDKKRDASGAFQLQSYAATQTVIESIKAVGDDPAKVAAHMRKTTFDTPIGAMAWDAKGDLKSYDFKIYEWHKDGSKTLATQ